MTPDREPEVSLQRVAHARSMAIDAYTVEVVEALRGRDVRSILLKGPALGALLYSDGAPRAYVDCDLLVAPDMLPAAASVLTDLGFQKEELDPALAAHAHPWFRAEDGAQVDLHHTLAAVSVSPEDAWRALSPHTETMEVARREVEVPTAPVRALIVALHVVHHGSEAVHAHEDLRRAVSRLSDEVWIEATLVAERMNALAPLATALRLTPAGAALAGRLGLVSPELVEATLRPGSSAGVALGFERLAARNGLPAKARFLWSELFPSRDFIRWWWPPAARGRLWLGAGYVRRLGWILRHGWPSLVLWRRVRRRAPAASRPLSPPEKARLAAEVLRIYWRVYPSARRRDIRSTLDALRTPGTHSPQSAESLGEALRLGRAVTRVLRHMPGDSRCLTQSLVLTRMLARRGIPSRLVIGVRAAPEFGAHAWVELDGRPLLPPGSGEYERLAEL